MDKGIITATEIESMFTKIQDEKQRDHLMRFFKTGEGEYGEGDMFLGIKVPQTRAIVKELKLQVEFDEIEKLLCSPWHEVRLCALLLLVEEMKSNLPRKNDDEVNLVSKAAKREKIARFYLRHARRANNWDLVDLSCQYVLGPYIRLAQLPDYNILLQLAQSDNLWEQRIAIVTTLDFIRNGIYNPTLALCDKFKTHPHDLIHKAIGWTLREIGKKDLDTLTLYLEKNYMQLPRTSLRYAIERMSAEERTSWLKRE